MDEDVKCGQLLSIPVQLESAAFLEDPLCAGDCAEGWEGH